MAKNSGGSSRIPVPRAVRPAFLPKTKPTKLLGTGQHSAILSERYQFLNYDDGSILTKGKVHSPQGKSHGKGYTISGIWPAYDNPDQLSCLREKELALFSGLVENKQQSSGSNNSCGYADATAPSSASGPHYLMLNKQNSFEHDESLGILTPDQMTDFTVALECLRTPSSENLASSTKQKSSSEDSATTAPEVQQRSPSPEELPLDPKPSAEPSRASVLPSSFVTSVTSITSLEAGYQGDGENSRPASRGPEAPALPPANVIAQLCRPDPMTDSDFFTESDADAHEEIGRGDRRAQVIDGTLFCAPAGRRCPSFMAEEMDSSGIYSDFDKRQDEGPLEAVFSDAHSPDTVDTELSQRSQPSPLLILQLADPNENQNVEVSPTKSLSDLTELHNSSGMSEHSVAKVSTKSSNPDIAQAPSLKSDVVALKKYKMPKRNVISKIKAMIASGQKEEPDKDARRAQRPARKNGRWDAVMSKIEAGKTEQRMRVSRKEVQSRVLQNLNNPASPSTSSNRRKLGDANNNAARNGKDKRRLRGRQELRSPTQETARSSVRSSASDLSSAHGKDVPKRIASGVGNSTRRQPNGLNNHQKTRTNTNDIKKNRLESQINNHDKRSVTINGRHGHTISSRSQNAAAVTSAKERGTKEPTNTTNEHNNRQVIAPPDVIKRDQSIQTVNTFADFANQQDHELALQALAITIQYSSSQVDQQRLLLENEKEEHQRNLSRLHEELEAQYVERVESLEAAMRDEKREVTRLQGALADSAKEHRLAISRLQTEYANEIAKRDAEAERRIAVSDHGCALIAEAESLRSVLELKSEEVAALRAENDTLRRQLDAKNKLEQRVLTLEARCEDLKEQLITREENERRLSQDNQLLLDSCHQISKLNERHNQRIEELEWRLRQKNKSKSFTNQSQSINNSPRSYNPDRDQSSNHQNWLGEEAEVPMVKYLIEKEDSVSWTLEMDGYHERHMSTNNSSSRSAKSVCSPVSRQSSLRVAKSRNRSFEPLRTRSTSFSESSVRSDSDSWVGPSANSTPKNRRNNRSKVMPEASINGPIIVIEPVDEEVNSGPRPQEAGGEAMISEETSASSSEDESSAGSDIQAIAPNKLAWRKPATPQQ